MEKSEKYFLPFLRRLYLALGVFLIAVAVVAIYVSLLWLWLIVITAFLVFAVVVTIRH